MKPCPFCAEQIQDAAIKCRHCGSMLDNPPPERDSIDDGPRDRLLERNVESSDRPSGPDRRSERDRRERRVLYSGFPSWRAFVGQYLLAIVGGVAGPALGWWLTGWLDVSSTVRMMSIAAPIAIAVIAFLLIGLYRRSFIVRISTTNIETEYGILSKKIDVIELWRCRDVRYRQSLLDRILRIAHIDIFTADVTTPNLSVLGLPASRQLFEKIRDSIEIQRHSRNVLGIVD